MKKTITVAGVTTLIIAVVAAASFARGGRHGFGWPHGPGAGMFGYRFEMMLERAADRLGLSTVQRDKIFAVVDNARPAMRALRFAFADHHRALRQLSPADDQYRDRLQEIADEVGKLTSQAVVLFGETRAKIAAVLTEEQRQKMRQMLQERRRHPRWSDR